MTNEPSIPQMKIRALPRSPLGEGRFAALKRAGFRHQGREVQPGEVIECDADIARGLITTGKAEPA